MKKGDKTPWGPAQTVKEFAPGIVQVTTASHGGFWVSDARLEELNTRLGVLGGASSQYTTFCGSANWWEEDCDWAVIATAFPEAFPAHVRDIGRQQLETMSKVRGGKYRRAWESLR